MCWHWHESGHKCDIVIPSPQLPQVTASSTAVNALRQRAATEGDQYSIRYYRNVSQLDIHTNQPHLPQPVVPSIKHHSHLPDSLYVDLAAVIAHVHVLWFIFRTRMGHSFPETCINDMHSLTVPPSPLKLKDSSYPWRFDCKWISECNGEGSTSRSWRYSRRNRFSWEYSASLEIGDGVCDKAISMGCGDLENCSKMEIKKCAQRVLSEFMSKYCVEGLDPSPSK